MPIIGSQVRRDSETFARRRKAMLGGVANLRGGKGHGTPRLLCLQPDQMRDGSGSNKRADGASHLKPGLTP